MKTVLPLFSLIVFACFYPSAVFSKNNKSRDHLNINVNEPEQSIKCSILVSRNIKISPDRKRTYFWYSSNQILSTQGGFYGQLLDGAYTSFYLNNNLKEKGLFSQGLKSGEWRTWHENGIIKEISYWKKSLRSGKYEAFDDKGEKRIVAYYKNDKLNGKKYTYSSGKTTSIVKFRNGKEIKSKIIAPKKAKEKKSKEQELQSPVLGKDKNDEMALSNKGKEEKVSLFNKIGNWFKNPKKSKKNSVKKETEKKRAEEAKTPDAK